MKNLSVTMSDVIYCKSKSIPCQIVKDLQPFIEIYISLNLLLIQTYLLPGNPVPRRASHQILDVAFTVRGLFARLFIVKTR